MRLRPTPAQFLQDCFLAGVEAVRPEHCLPPALAAAGRPHGPCAVLAVGKAAPGMARVIAESLAASGALLLPALVVGVAAEGVGLVGDHPVPGPASARAAESIADWVRDLPSEADVHIAISGGASALIAAPLPGLTFEDLREAFSFLLGSGLDVDAMNAVRKRLARWSAGRLARALAPRRTFVWLISDVPGDDPSTIGSGPCHGDPWTSAQLRTLLERRALWSDLSSAVRAAVEIETLKPDAAGLGEVRWDIVARNADALAASAQFAARLGIKTHLVTQSLSGEASETGRTIARKLLQAPFGASTPNILCLPAPQPPELWLYGGETVVSLGDATTAGGRNQELALAAAEVLATPGSGDTTVLLAAGTDGRDGATTEAGAIVDGSTWQRMTARGRNPREDLVRHRSHDALVAANAVIRTGHTGTNVMDVVLALSDRWSFLYPPEERLFDRGN